MGMAVSRISQIATPKQQAALNAASDYLDGLIVSHADLPLVAPYPQDVIDFECVVASYRLLLNVGLDPRSMTDKALKEQYDEKISWAKQIAAGEITPTWLDSSSDGGEGGPFVITSSSRGYSERAPLQPPANVDPFTGD